MTCKGVQMKDIFPFEIGPKKQIFLANQRWRFLAMNGLFWPCAGHEWPFPAKNGHVPAINDPLLAIDEKSQIFADICVLAVPAIHFGIFFDLKPHSSIYRESLLYGFQG
ncbi:hypothetical protein HYC85_029548 [Camellia sinensis]|uniref:Uncharacterized protein n=1 Tax=Camellia sinensis TaxID=4442 RepID=A0A7J7FYY2_CAMSI|nr:hypothetical protein HYC85_029548 [Camellia sinensis]